MKNYNKGNVEKVEDLDIEGFVSKLSDKFIGSLRKDLEEQFRPKPKARNK